MSIRRARTHDRTRSASSPCQPRVEEIMPAGTTGAATIRHVGLVALEAMLVAILVWLATMALAGASQSDGIVGSATAGGVTRGPIVSSPSAKGVAVVTAGPTEGGDWLHISCRANGNAVGAQWSRIGSDRRVRVALDAVSETATCVVEQGYFSANGKWRVLSASPFTIAD
jgi:hypothetical protein